MKIYLKLIFLSTILATFCSCKENTQNQVEKIDTHKKVNIYSNKTSELKNDQDNFKFITAESGLNYRDKPNGKVIGKFDWKDKVEYLFKTEQTESIIDDYNKVEGTWVAIKQEKDTVYVFDYFLSEVEPYFSKIKLYYADPYYSAILKPSNKKDIRHAFVNVSESFNMPKNFINKNDLQKDTIHFDKKQRKEFLKRMKYSNNDTLFVYDIKSGLIKKHPIKSTPLMACISIYSRVNEDRKTEDYYETDYQIGFNLGKVNDEGFAIIGNKNPFVEKGLKPLIFKEMGHKMINNNVEANLLPTSWIDDTNYKPYISNYENIRVFVKIKKEANLNSWYDLIIKNIETKKSYYVYQTEGESSGKASIALAEKKSIKTENYQYIGRLFKNKPPVAFGFMWESFACPQIHFLKTEALSIRILCDNRH